MSEMSAEKKKQIEDYILKSYFGNYKNVKPYIGGVDLISGSCDIPDLLVEVEFFNSKMVIIRWNVQSESGSVWENEFIVRVCREREIERNRCDSVDAMSYAWEAWRAKIQGKPVFMKTNDEDLQKDKCIEELERTVKALKAEKEVMDRHIQELELENASLGEANERLKNNKDSYLRMVQTGAGYLKDWEEATGCDKPEHVKKKISALENECRVWHDTADHQLEQIHGLEDDVNKFYEMFDGCSTPEEAKELINGKNRRITELKGDLDASLSANEELKKKLHEFDPMPEFKELFEKLYSAEDAENLEWVLEHICGGRSSVNGWRVVSSFWKQHYEELSKLVGFSSVEEIQDYLTNEAECDTLHEAVSKLKDQVKYTCDEWYSANSRNNSWKAAAECNTPKELIEKMNLLRDNISGHDAVIESYELNIKKWQKATGFSRPEDILETNLFVKATQLEHENTILNGALKEWKEVTGCPSPSAAKTLLGHYCDENKELESQIEEWKKATERCTPFLANVRLSTLRDSYIRNKRLLFGEVRPEVMVCIEGDKKTIRQYLRDRDFASVVNAINELEFEIDEWRKATGCLNPRYAKIKIDAYDSYIGSNLKKKD